MNKAAPAAGERQQHHAAGQIESPSTLHARENASSFFNEASTLPRREFVKDKEALARCNVAAKLSRRALERGDS